MSSSDVENWTRVASVEDVGEGEIHAVEIGDLSVALYRLEDDDGFFATDNICTHAHAYLSDGWLDGDVVECPLHGGCFNVRSGKGLCAPVTEDIKTYPVRVSDGAIFIDLPK